MSAVRTTPPLDSMPRVAYVMNGFPRLSETFIAHEIHQLERLGLPLRLYSVKQEREAFAHPVVGAIRAPLVYLPDASSLSGTTLLPWLRDNLPTFAGAHATLLRRRPLAWLATLGSALALAWKHRPTGTPFALRKVFIKEFLQAGWIANAVLRDGDVSHLHGHFCHGVATITWFASRLTGLPFSFTAHAKDIYQAELNPGRLLERKLGAARFVATCTCANAHVLRARHPRPDDVHAIYHGLDTQWFSPRPSALSADAPLVLSVGRLVEKKGFDRLIAACALLKQRGVDFRCTIVGEDGSAGPALRAQIDTLNVADRVELHRAVTQDRLREIYRDARAFALPCRVMADGDRDGFPKCARRSHGDGRAGRVHADLRHTGNDRRRRAWPAGRRQCRLAGRCGSAPARRCPLARADRAGRARTHLRALRFAPHDG